MKNKGTSFFRNLVFILLLILFCVLISFAIVWPLWAFSQAFKTMYTIIGITIISFIIIFVVFKYLRKKGLSNSIKLLINIILISAAIIIPVILIINTKRLAGIIVFIVLIVLITIVNLLWKKIVHEK